MGTKRAKLGRPHVFAQGNPLQLHLCPVKLHHPGLAFAHRQQLASSLRPCSGRALSHIVVVQCNIQQCVLLNLLWTALQLSIAKSIPALKHSCRLHSSMRLQFQAYSKALCSPPSSHNDAPHSPAAAPSSAAASWTGSPRRVLIASVL